MYMNQIPFNTASDGTSRTIKANYWKMSRANFAHGGHGATAIAVIPDMEEPAERMGI